MTAAVTVLSNPGTWHEGDNPFLRLLLESYEDDIDVVPFSWPRALRGRWDVLHVHWVERLVRGRNAPHRAAKAAALVMVLLRAKIMRRRVVWTVHNESPHESAGRGERALLWLWRRSADELIVMSPLTELRPRRRQRVTEIPHGHYLPTLPASSIEGRPAGGPGLQLLFFGQIRPYKGLETLVAAFRVGAAGAVAPWHLTIAGQPVDAEYGARIRRLVADAPDIDLIDRHVPDPQLVELAREADAVVLPYRRLLNSGAALLALSFGRPVLVPVSASTTALRDEIGHTWVRLFDHPLSADHLAALQSDPAHGTPDLSSRDWEPIGRAYSALFRSVARRRP